VKTVFSCPEVRLHDSAPSIVFGKKERGMTQTRMPVALALTVLGACGQTAKSQAAFEVASIKLSVDATRKPSIGASPGGERFTARNMPLLWLLSSAYDVSIRQISGLPKSFNSKSYDIEAKPAQRASRKQMMKMLQTLIEDRFELRLRHESKELSAYVLTVAKDGPKLDENTTGADLEARNSGAGRESYRNFPMPIFANILAAHLDETVVDKTGLNSSYDFMLEFRPESVTESAKDTHEPAANLDGPSLFTALREQLGLELRRQKVAVELLVIDHIEEPSGN
jgi:uncharacterized protein (TIGR03435 family)